MIRVLVAEDEPPIQRRTKRLIEHIDPDFSVVATAGDGEEALEKMSKQHIDVLFTDIRMPVMDGMQLMKKMQTLHPDCAIVVVSGYRDFEYVSSAVRAQAVDYLLKPVTEEMLEKLLFTLKETYKTNKQEQLQQSVASRINHMIPYCAPDNLQAVQVGVCLFCAGSMPNIMEFDSDRQNMNIWGNVSLTELAKSLCGDHLFFVQEYIGDSASERILVYQQKNMVGSEWIRELYQNVLEQSDLLINCVNLSDAVAVSNIGTICRKLNHFLTNMTMIGKSLYKSVSLEVLNAPGNKTNESISDSEKAMQFADIIISKNPFNVQAFHTELFMRFDREGWTQRRILSFFMCVITFLEARSQNPGNVFQCRKWFRQAVSEASSLGELEEIVKSLNTFDDMINDGNETIQNVEKYLRDHYIEHITGQVLSKEFGYVPSYISYLFRKAYGQSPVEYLTKLRLDKAKELMHKHPSLLVRDIAEQVGYKNQFHFSRVFKRVEGIWPSDFKN